MSEDCGGETIDRDLPPRPESVKDKEYDYLYRGDSVSSEWFKLEIINVPKHFHYHQITKRLKRDGVDAQKVKCASRGSESIIFLAFKNSSAMNEAEDRLSRSSWVKRFSLEVRRSRPMRDPFVVSREAAVESQFSEPSATPTNDQMEQKMLDNVEPLRSLPYNQQLSRKWKEMRRFLIQLAQKSSSANPVLKPLFVEMRKTNGETVASFDSIRSSPTISAYRNKVEFSVACRISGDISSTVVGFRSGQYKDGSCAVTLPQNCSLIPDVFKQVGKLLQGFIADSGLLPFDQCSHGGHWRCITVRRNKQNDVLIIPQLCQQNLTNDQIEAVRQELVAFVANTLITSGVRVSGFLLHVSENSLEQGLSASSTLLNVYGDNHIVETIGGYHFRISPSAFFQINSTAANVLYRCIGEMADLRSNTILLDLCCGTGTIGIFLSGQVAKVIGVDISSESIDDAKWNVERNRISNAEYRCEKLENVIRDVLSAAVAAAGVEGSNIVAVLDPPRAGVHSAVTCAIRACDAINKLVYVSCNAAGAERNFIELTRLTSKKYRGGHFVLTRATGVDLFPNTPHCELVALFERGADRAGASTLAVVETTLNDIVEICSDA